MAATNTLEILIKASSGQAVTELKKLDTQLGKVGADFDKAFGAKQQRGIDAYIKGLSSGSATTKDFQNVLTSTFDKTGMLSSEFSRMAKSSGLFSDSQLKAGNAMRAAQRKADELALAVKNGEMSARDAGKAFGDFTKTLDTGTGGVSGFTTNLKSMITTIGIAIGVMAAVGVAAKKAFDLGAEGAAIAQTKQSFDRLLVSVGAAPDLLDQLRSSARGTVDDMTLMSSTATLLAGVTGDLAVEMANAAPQILEIAKAANKLNPTLGDTAFLYQSLMTGIKRGSPLLIDNTGLTLKLGEANEKMAQKLGKTVEQLTDAEKRQAILNATLEAGSTLIQQVGGDVASATDEYQRFSAQVKNATDQLKENATKGISPVVKILGDWLDKTMKEEAALTDLQTALRLGLITQKEYDDAVQHLLMSEQGLNYEREKAINLLQRYYDKMNKLGNSELNLIRINDDLAGGIREVGGAMGDAASEAARVTAEISRWQSELDQLTAQKALDDWVDTLDEIQRGMAAARFDFRINFKAPDIGGLIENWFDEEKWRNAGGDALQAAFENVGRLFEDNKITEAQASGFFSEIYVAAQNLQVELGNITAYEAAQNIRDTLGVSLQDAKKLIDDIKNSASFSVDSYVFLNYVIKDPKVEGIPGTGSGKRRWGGFFDLGAGDLDLEVGIKPEMDDAAWNSIKGEISGTTEQFMVNPLLDEDSASAVRAARAEFGKAIVIPVSFNVKGGPGGFRQLTASEKRYEVINQVDLNGNGIIGRQFGGMVMPGEKYIVGERGPELFVPGMAGRIIPNNQSITNSVNNAPVVNNYNFVIEAQAPFDVRDLARRITKEQQRVGVV